MTTDTLIGAYVFSILGGHFIARYSVNFMRKECLRYARINDLEIPKDLCRENIWWLQCMIGFAERSITFFLLIYAPSVVPAFIGAWIALKFAAGWGRIKDPRAVMRAIQLIALLGNAISFSCAVGAGLYVAPESIRAFAPESPR